MEATKIEPEFDENITPLPHGKTLCLMQLTRLGDLIQAIQIAKSIKEVHPSIKLILVARKQFATPLKFIIDECFDKSYLVDLADFTSTQSKDLDLTMVNHNISKFTEKINLEGINVLVNLSFSKISSVLSNLIDSTYKLGLYHDNEGAVRIQDRWSKYVYSTVMSGPLNPFALIDIFKNIVGIDGIQSLPISKISSDKINSITLHPFASNSKKMWKPSKWGEIIYKLLKDNSKININLIGHGTEEQKLADKVLENPLLNKFKDRITNLVNKTTLKQLFEIIEKETNLFVGHDSMVGHIASFYGKKSVTISLGTVRPIETIPYGAENYSISPRTKCYPCFPNELCSYFQCHADVPYQTVSSAINQIILTGEISKKTIEEDTSTFHTNSVNIHKSYFTNEGNLEFESVINHDFNLSELLKKFYRILWLYALNESEESVAYPSLNSKTHKDLLHYASGIQTLYELCEFGQKYTKFILEEVASQNPNLQKIREFSEKIDEIDRLQNIVKDNYPGLAPLVNYFTVLKGNVEGSNLVELSENSFLNYHANAALVSAFYELLSNTIAEFKHKGKNKTQNATL